MTTLRPAALFALLAIAAACAGRAPSAPRACQRVPGLPGPEDFALDLGAQSPRLLVSSQQRWRGDDGAALPDGTIAAVPLTADGLGPAQPLALRNRDALPFHPHGVDLWTTATGERRLLVINHLAADTHAVEEFGVLDDSLVFRRRLQNPLLRSPNDLIAAGDDELYASNDHSLPGALAYLEGAFALPGGDLVHYRGGRWQVVVEAVAYANGVELDAAGERLYLAAVREERVREYPRDPATGALGPLTRSFEVGSGVDNLLWQDPRTLLVAAHPDVLAFARHASDATALAPSQVFALDVDSGAVRLLFADDGRQVAAASTAWRAAGRLILGQVFADGLVSCALP